MTIRTERYLTRDQQFCTLCYATGHGWVRVIHLHRLLELRQQHGTERQAKRAYDRERERALQAHYAQAHPDKHLG